MTIDLRPASTRFHTELDWLDSWHSFSFGPFHDPQNTHHGLLLVNNDDVIAGGGGFGTHPHSDMEIVTWVLRGELEHRDSEGNEGIIYPGLAQRMSAGTRHPPLRGERQRHRRRPPRADVGAARHARASPPATSSATSATRSTRGGLVVGRVGPGPRGRGHHPPARRDAARRPSPRGRVGHRAGGPARARVRAGRRRASSPHPGSPSRRSPPATRPAAPTRASWSSSPARRAARCSCG